MQARTSTILIWAGDGITHHIPVTRAIAQCLAFSPDANQLYVGLDSGHLMWWPAGPTGSPQSALLTHGGSVDLAVAPDNRSLLLAGNDGYVQLWDVGARQVRQTYDWQIGTISRVAFAPDGLTAAAAGDGVVMVWDIDS